MPYLNNKLILTNFEYISLYQNELILFFLPNEFSSFIYTVLIPFGILFLNPNFFYVAWWLKMDVSLSLVVELFEFLLSKFLVFILFIFVEPCLLVDRLSTNCS